MKSLLTLLIVGALALFVAGCGDDNNGNFVVTGPVPVGTGNLTFNFTQNQGAINVPVGTTTLIFTFFDGLNQTGNVTLVSTNAFAATITIQGVPVSTRSFRIVARNANNVDVATATGNVAVVLNQTVVVNLTGALVVLTPPNATAINLLVSNNPTAFTGNLDLFNRLTVLVRTFVGGGDQGIALDELSTGFHNNDTTVNILGRATTRTADFAVTRDRTFTVTGAAGLKGSDVAPLQGLVILADFTGGQIIVISSAGTSNNVVATANTANNPWDVAYDEANDRLYVAFTNGDIGVYDGWVAGGFNAAPTRTITHANLDNAHGISFDAASNKLVVSDVGAATGAAAGAGTDGEIFVFSNASTANGATNAVRINGTNTLLGDPVDIDLINGDLRVAEKNNDRILTFSGILNSTGGNLAPAVNVAEDNPESLTSENVGTLGADNSDIDGGVTVQNLLVSLNPGAANGSFVRIATSLTGGTTTFDPNIGTNGESIKVDGQGDVFQTGDGGRLAQYARVASGRRDAVPFNVNRDRQHPGGGVSATNFKGLDVVDSLGYLIIADFGGNAVRVVGKNGDYSAPLFTTNVGAAPWDVDYDPTNDRLFVALTNGNVLVFDGYFAGNPNTATANRTIDITGGVNCHGIVHDAANNVLLVSDIGTAAGTADGRLFVINNASTADGVTAPAVDINGAAALLSAPVDIAYDGTNLFVAEKTNGGGALHRFDNIRASAGGNVAPSATTAMTNPESVSLVTGL